MVKSAVLVWFILIAGKPTGMTFETKFLSITECTRARAHIELLTNELKETGIDIDVYTSCEQDR